MDHVEKTLLLGFTILLPIAYMHKNGALVIVPMHGLDLILNLVIVVFRKSPIDLTTSLGKSRIHSSSWFSCQWLLKLWNMNDIKCKLNSSKIVDGGVSLYISLIFLIGPPSFIFTITYAYDFHLINTSPMFWSSQK